VWDQFRAAMRLQAVFTVAAAAIAGWLAGIHGAVSAALGGLIGIAGGLAFVLIASKSKRKSAGDALVVALEAEGAKLLVMIVLVVAVLKSYRQGVALVVIGSFVVSALIFSIGAFAGRTDKQQKV